MSHHVLYCSALFSVHAHVHHTNALQQVVLRKARDGEWVAIESAVRALTLLNEVMWRDIKTTICLLERLERHACDSHHHH